MSLLSRRNFVRNAAATVAGVSLPGMMEAQSRGKRALRIIHMADVHLDTRPIAGKNFKKVLVEINAMKDKPDLIVNTGDSVFRADGTRYEEAEAQWNLFTGMLSEHNRIPMKACIGNHDVWYGPDPTTDESYKSNKRYYKNWVVEALDLPDRYYSKEFKGWQFIALDSINHNEYSIDKEQFTWLEKELQRIPKQTPICVFSHVSILSIIPLMRSLKQEKLEDIHFPASTQHRDAFELKNLFYKHPNVKLCLSGHTHQVDKVDFLGVQYLCGGAVCGNWWGDNRDSIVFDEFPPAYTIIDLYEDGTINHKNIFYDFLS